MQLNLTKRKEKAKEANLCFNCLSPSDAVKDYKAGECTRRAKKFNSLMCIEKPSDRHLLDGQSATEKGIKKGHRQEQAKTTMTIPSQFGSTTKSLTHARAHDANTFGASVYQKTTSWIIDRTLDDSGSETELVHCNNIAQWCAYSKPSENVKAGLGNREVSVKRRLEMDSRPWHDQSGQTSINVTLYILPHANTWALI